MAVLILIAFVFILPIKSHSQNFEGRMVIGKNHAKQEIEGARKDSRKSFYDTLITDREIAISVVEPILFNYYGKENILKERPYEVYLIDGYWYIAGTLPVGYHGGVFEIIIHAADGKVIALTHGK